MSSVCSPERCTGCRACEKKCTRQAITIVDSIDSICAEINNDLCIDCGLCRRVCPIHNSVEKLLPIQWYQGWANDSEIRSKSSSGGIASALIKKFIQNGGYVCSCKFEQGNFLFVTTNDIEEAKGFAGSKYVKSNPITAYDSISELLKKGESVLFIGLPCQIAALKNYVPVHEQNKLFCVDLICHGTPSIKLLKLFLQQHNVDIENLERISFRVNGRMGLNIKKVTPEGVIDRYLISFLQGLNYTEGCYNCNYACTHRVSDITLGDNWGTELEDELIKGLSLILCITEKGKQLLINSDVNLLEVDIDSAIAENSQLMYPSNKPVGRMYFLQAIKKGKNYDRLIFRLYPKQCIKQILKSLAVKLKIYNLK